MNTEHAITNLRLALTQNQCCAKPTHEPIQKWFPGQGCFSSSLSQRDSGGLCEVFSSAPPAGPWGNQSNIVISWEWRERPRVRTHRGITSLHFYSSIIFLCCVCCHCGVFETPVSVEWYWSSHPYWVCCYGVISGLHYHLKFALDNH